MTPAYAKETKAAVSKTSSIKLRNISKSTEPLVFTDIYQEEINMVIWQRDLPTTLKSSIKQLLAAKPRFQANLTVTPQNISPSLRKILGTAEQNLLVDNIAELVDMFCSLFDISHAGLRLTTLDRAMCPKFHVDRVGCRLITTYQGMATEWLPDHTIDRTKLGLGSEGLPDSQSGLYQHHTDIQQLNCGDVALLKGETWHDNENAGLVHRSPTVAAGENRLLLTLDFAI